MKTRKKKAFAWLLLSTGSAGAILAFLNKQYDLQIMAVVLVFAATVLIFTLYSNTSER